MRLAKKWTQDELAIRSGLNQKSRVSKIERGENVKVEQYERVARGLGFRNALELFRTPGDPVMRRLARYWQLLDDAARRDVLAQVKAMIDREEEAVAITDEE